MPIVQSTLKKSFSQKCEVLCMAVDCRFDIDDKRFQFRVGAVIAEEDCVLLAKCDAADYYYSVGGAVKMGETAEDAVKREVFEETGVHYDVDRLLCVHENFFKDEVVLKGVTFHEVCLYFLMKPKGRKLHITQESFGTAGREYMHWIPVKELENIKAFPVFLEEKLLNCEKGVEHIVTNEL